MMNAQTGVETWTDKNLKKLFLLIRKSDNGNIRFRRQAEVLKRATNFSAQFQQT